MKSGFVEPGHLCGKIDANGNCSERYCDADESRHHDVPGAFLSLSAGSLFFGRLIVVHPVGTRIDS